MLAAVGALGLVAVLRIWPADDRSVLPHAHPDLPPDHPHLAGNGPGNGPANGLGNGHTHSHAVVIDDLHRHWPKAA